MSTQQSSRRVPSLSKSIDSVLDTAPASPPTRPIAKLRPSWIGPRPSNRPMTPGVQTMKQTVTVEYASPGLQPPVFICTSLSDPQWEPIEMQHVTGEHNEHVFSKSFDVEEGEYQYKFRLGEGDWWVCDQNKPTVDDGLGNKNNLLVVKVKSMLEMDPPKPEAPSTKAANKEMSPTSKAPEVVPLPQPSLPPVTLLTPAHDEFHVPAPLMKHETLQPPKGADAEHTPEAEMTDPYDDGDFGPSHPEVLLKHETFKPGFAEDSDGSDSSSSTSDDENEVVQNGSLPTPRRPSTKEQHAPLLRHESLERNGKAPEFPTRVVTPTKNAIHNPVPQEATEHDATLEKFPGHHAGILHIILDTHQRLPEDEFLEEHLVPSTIAPAFNDVIVTALSPGREVPDGLLEKIREAEEEEVEKEEADGEELDPLRVIAREPEDADFAPKIEIEEHIVIEVVEERKSLVEVLLDKMGGTGNAIAVAVGLLVIAAGICSMQFL